MPLKSPIALYIIALFSLLLSTNFSYSQVADFNVQHIQNDVARTGGSSTAFTPVSSLNNAFVLANNNRKTHGGSISSGGNMEGDDMSGARRLTATNTLTYYRASGSINQDMRFNSSIWEYVGPTGGCNEFIVRGRYTVSLPGTTNSVAQSISGVVNADNCIPFITGIINNDTNNGADSSTSVAYLENVNTLRVQKGTNSNDVTVYVTLVEFTGSNWTVLHGDSGNTGANTGTVTLRDNSDGTGTVTNVSDWSESIIFSHFRADTAASATNEAIEDLWPILDPATNNNQIDWTFQGSGHGSNGTNRHFVHVLSNPFLNVNRIQNSINTAGETTLTISPALTSINEAFIVGSSVSTGGGTAYGRGWRNYYLKSTTEAAHWAHRNGNGMSHEIQIIDLSGLTTQDIDVVDSALNAILDGSANSPAATNSTEFGNINIGSSLANTYTIENNGSCNLTISSITSSNSDFVVSSVPSSVAGGSTDSFIVTYTPNTPAGTATSTITITNNDSDAAEQSYTFTVQGTGVTPVISYCPSSGNTSFTTGINSVNFNTLSNSDTNNTNSGYEDFTAQSTDVVRGSAYDLSVNVDNGEYFFGFIHNENTYTQAWIDWNQDGDFDDAGENYNLGTGNTNNGATSNSPLSITVPAGATLGNTRMRISTRYNNSSFTSCNTGFDGEVEDYTINIIDVVVPLTEGPGGVTSNLQLWLKSTDGLGYTDGAAVSLWETQARGSNATVNTPGQEPTYRDNMSYNVNFNPVVDFDSSLMLAVEDDDYSYDDLRGDFLEGSSGMYTQDMFLVVLPDAPISSSGSNMDLFCGDQDFSLDENDVTGVGFGEYSDRFTDEILSYCIGTSAGYGVAETTPPGTTNYNNVGIINSRNNLVVTQQELYYNANNVETLHANLTSFINVNNSRYWIGRSEGYEASTNARIAEIVTFSSRLNATERAKVETYLAIKYGITLADAGSGTTQNYIDSDGNIIWDYTADGGLFNYGIAGIGRDDVAELNQKQSKSINSNSVVTIGHRDINATNSTNTNSFTTDRDYLVWGHNNAALSGSDNISINLGASSTSVTTLLDRRWRVQENRPTASNDILDVKVSIPAFVLPAISSVEEYALIVSSTASFGSNDIIDVIPLTANGTNFETWYDFDNTTYFTFGVASRVSGKFNVEFSTGDYLVGEDTVDLNTAYSVSAWVRNLGNGGTYISKGSAYDFRINASGNVEVVINGSVRLTSSQTINDSKWHHIAVTFSSGNLSLYIDGVEDVNSPAGSVSNPSATTDKFAIGVVYTNKNTISTAFNGDIDEVRVWNIALTQAQIQYIMNQEIEDLATNVNGAVLPQTTTLNQVAAIPWSNVRAYHNMNSFYGTSVEDGSNNNNWLRIKYLDTGKNIIDNQSAPLPYVSTNNGSWDLETTWENGSELVIPNTTALDGSTVIDWNIVETATNVNTTRNVKVLGLNNSANELSINDANYLEVSHYLKIDGVLDLDGESQLIQTTNSDFDHASTGYLERDQQGEGNRFRYNDWSMPVYTATDAGNISVNGTGNYTTVAASLRDGTNPSSPGLINYTSGVNGATSPLTLSEYWMYKYANLPDNTYSAWDHIGSAGRIYAGEGYLMKGTGNPGAIDQNYVFRGKPNNGDITLTIGAGNDYLVGNPYPSAIDAYKFIDDNLVATGPHGLYFWEHYGGDSHNLRDYQVGYAVLTKLGSAPASSNIPAGVDPDGSASDKIVQRYIPVGQGFFIWAGASNATINFNNSQRVFITEASGDSVFMKGEKGKSNKTSQNEDVRPKIRIGFNAPGIDHRQLLVGADDKATEGVDLGYEAVIYEVLNDDMYWLIDNDKYIIQAVHKINSETELPVGIKSKKGGIISIKVDELINTPEDIEVYVLDKETNQTFNIKNQTFETVLEANTNYTNRYSIVFKENIALNVNEEILADDLLVYVNNSEKNLIIKNNTNFEIEEIVLYNYLGQNIQQWNSKFDEKILTLPIKNKQGAYIIKLITSKGVLSKKIIIE